MAVLGRLGPARHAAVGAAVVGTALAGLLGVGESHEERFDAKQLTIFPVGENALRVREVVDQDFGSADRHGYERIIYDDYGAVTDVEASSPDAPADLDVSPMGGSTRIRIGDPNDTITGQHRYELAYTYPAARLSTGELALDLVEAGSDQETLRFEIVITGFELADVRCDTGAAGADGGCTVAADGEVYRGIVEPLPEDAGVTISATILGRTAPADVAVPALPDRRSPSDRLVRAGAMGGASAAAATGMFLWSRRRGRNEIYAGGAADAAYGHGPTARSGAAMVRPPGTPLPPPGLPGAASTTAPTSTFPATRFVTDAELGDLATIEFVPPNRITPWEGAALLKEGVDSETVGAWFSGLAASDVLSIEKHGDAPVLRPGPRIDEASAADRPLLQALFGGAHEIELGTYDREFARVWSNVRSMQSQAIAESGWWSRRAAGGGNIGVVVLLIASIFLAVASSTAIATIGFMIGGTVPAVILAALVGLVVAAIAYHKLRAARTATGSALALRTESFRRFLAASEGQHVEWAWQQGLLREYSAWAVALGAADAWERALASSSVPPTERVSGPLLVYSMGSSFGRSYTAPSSSGGGGGGGGFGGGGVGGGGGGGSSGSW